MELLKTTMNCKILTSAYSYRGQYRNREQLVGEKKRGIHAGSEAGFTREQLSRGKQKE